VGLNRLVLEVVRLTHSIALSGCCAVLTELEPGLPLVHVDPVQLQQVLLNLVLNAFEALQEVPAPGRRLVLATKADAGRSLVHAIVRDFGPGLFASAVEGTGLKRWRRQKF
jgi:C4-dicarboxylate-specific signal transduction histidine kinase